MPSYGLPTKLPEHLVSSRVLGLQLGVAPSCDVSWRQREGSDMQLPEQPSKRDVFIWCGRLTGHLPVCGWLRPYCSFLKRMANASGSWDDVILDPTLLGFCGDVSRKLTGDGDPALGV